MSFTEKLKSLMIEIQLSSYKLSKMSGVSEMAIGRILNNVSNPNSSTKKSLCDALGVDENFNKIVTNDIEVSFLNAETSSIMFVPLVTQYAYAGYLSGYSDEEYLESLPKVPFILDKEYKGQYLCFEVKGDSMECENEESINEGSILLCRNVRQDYWKSKLHINKWDFVIVTKTEGILVKRISKHDVEKGIIILHSLNEFYTDKEVHLKNVDQIFNIVEVQQKRKRR